MIFSAPDAIGEKQALRERWLQHVFDNAAADQDSLDQGTAINLIQKLSGQTAATERIRQKLLVSDTINFSFFLSRFIILLSCQLIILPQLNNLFGRKFWIYPDV